MKKLFLITTCLLATLILNAQSLEDIVKNFSIANKYDQLKDKKTIKIIATISLQGQEMPLEIWMKKPNKIRSVAKAQGQDVIEVFDGEKGYKVNPMTGSSTPVEMSAEEVKRTLRNNTFENTLENDLKAGQLMLLGEDAVNGKPVYKIKDVIDQGTVSNIFIDKATWLPAKQTIEITQGGMPMTIETYPSDYTEINGIIMPMKTTTSVNGMEMVITFTKVEVDIPIEDSIFTLK
jgi:outer membrane lipoprotein-sorting protein